MGAALFTEWYDELSMHAPGATLAGMEIVLKSTIAEFLRDSGAYCIELPGIIPTAGKDSYILNPQPEGPVLYIQAISYNGRFLVSMQTPAFRGRMLGTSTDNQPRAYRTYTDFPGKFTLVPGLAQDGLFQLIPFVSIGFNGSCQSAVSDMFKLRWYDYILAGCIAKLLSQQNKPYSNVPLAFAHSRKFRTGIAQARDMAHRQFSNTESDFVFPAWA